MKLLVFGILFLSCEYSFAQNTYKISLFRAAPGQMLELLDDLKDRAKEYQATDNAKPLIVRHSQGDHWDYFVVEYVKSLSDYFRGSDLSEHAFTPGYGNEFYNMIAHHEQLFVNGPDVNSFSKMVETFAYFHIEMFVALPGKQKELLTERKMENVYLNEIGRNENLVFTAIFGSKWDNITLGGYRDIKHFAESADISLEVEEKAALKAGFKGVNDISPYLRSLISRHNDTLGGKVDYLQESK